MLRQNNHFEKFQGRSGQCPKHFCFFLFSEGNLRLLMNLVSLATKWGNLQFKGELNRADWNDILRQYDRCCNQ